MTIGRVAKESGVAASAIRFYEEAGILPVARRLGGRRQYDSSVLERLAVIARAKACGFSLAETRLLFYGFGDEAPPSVRWETLARPKIAELGALAVRIEAARELLQRPCVCRDLAECGQRIARNKPRDECEVYDWGRG